MSHLLETKRKSSFCILVILLNCVLLHSLMQFQSIPFYQFLVRILLLGMLVLAFCENLVFLIDRQASLPRTTTNPPRTGNFKHVSPMLITLPWYFKTGRSSIILQASGMSTTENSAYNSHLCFSSPSTRGRLMVPSTAMVLSPNPTNGYETLARLFLSKLNLLKTSKIIRLTELLVSTKTHLMPYLFKQILMINGSL